MTFYQALVNDMFDGDAHMQAAFKDFTMVTMGQGTKSDDQKSIMQFAPDISTIVTDLGFRGQNNAMLSKLGKSVAKAYRNRHGTAPDKTQKYVNGSVRSVNAYKQSDVSMIQEIIRDTLETTK